MLTTVLVASVLAVSAQTDYFSEMDQEDDILLGNVTDIGDYLDAPCLESCHPNLVHVVCKKETQRCECEPGYPVRLDLYTGCAKPVKLGDQCYYLQPCIFSDPNAECVQIRHNAICQCKPGFHTVTIAKSKRSFCSEDIVVIATDMSTLLGVATGLMVITALICFTLKLFVGTKPRRNVYANSNIAPSIYFDQTGMAGVSVLRGGFTRSSRGVLVPSSRAGAARAAAILLISCHLSPSHGPRMKLLPSGKMKTKGWRLINQFTAPSLASVHSSTSSTRSFSARQYEREKENRLLARARNRERDGNSPSPRSCENLIDDPLPSDSWPKENEEGRECEAFTPDILEKDFEGSLPHIDDPLTMEVDNTVPPLPSPTAYKDPKPTR